jgi:hypothetical protein
MGSWLPGWSGAVGSCLAIQATILMAGSLIGVSQHVESRGLGLKATSPPLGPASEQGSGAEQLAPGWSQQVRIEASNTIR